MYLQRMATDSFFKHPIQIEGKVYMASDFHFGAPDEVSSKSREEAVARWMDQISQDADHLFLLGDVFDFWFEYKDVIPKGNLLFLSKLLELKRKGIQIHFFTGNHDMWVNDFFSKDLDIPVYRQQQGFIINGKRCLLGHGDGLNPADRGYLFIKKLFANPVCIALYGALPPRWAFHIARKCSQRSRQSHSNQKPIQDKESSTIAYIRQVCAKEPIDFFFFGHHHSPLQMNISDNTQYINIGDWLSHSSYLAWEAGSEPQLLEFQ